MLTGLKNAFSIKELRGKIIFTIAMLVLYRLGAHIPVPGIPFQGITGLFSNTGTSVASGAMALLNLFSGGALAYVSVFSLGIMPYITSSIILQMLQAVVPSLHELAREGEVGQTKITQYSRYLTLALAILNSIGYLFLFKSFGIRLQRRRCSRDHFRYRDRGHPCRRRCAHHVDGRAHHSARYRQRHEPYHLRQHHRFGSFCDLLVDQPSSAENWEHAASLTTVYRPASSSSSVIPADRLRRAWHSAASRCSYAKRVVRDVRMMGGQKPRIFLLKVNAAGVIPIIFASALALLPGADRSVLQHRRGSDSGGRWRAVSAGPAQLGA